MKGLLLKDLYMSVAYLKSFLFVILVFLGVSAFEEDNWFFVMYPVMIAGMIPVSLVSYDEREKWNSYSAALPYSRASLVTAKYLIGLIFESFTFVISLAFQSMRMLITNTFSLSGFFSLTGAFLIISLIAPTFLMPFIFRFGPEKGRIAFFVLIAFFSAAIGLLASLKINVPSAFSGFSANAWILPLLCMGMIFLYICSWRLSISFYRRKEL